MAIMTKTVLLIQTAYPSTDNSNKIDINKSMIDISGNIRRRVVPTSEVFLVNWKDDILLTRHIQYPVSGRSAEERSERKREVSYDLLPSTTSSLIGRGATEGATASISISTADNLSKLA